MSVDKTIDQQTVKSRLNNRVLVSLGVLVAGIVIHIFVPFFAPPFFGLIVALLTIPILVHSIWRAVRYRAATANQSIEPMATIIGRLSKLGVLLLLWLMIFMYIDFMTTLASGVPGAGAAGIGIALFTAPFGTLLSIALVVMFIVNRVRARDEFRNKPFWILFWVASLLTIIAFVVQTVIVFQSA
ncbi:MAG TPA: hypothetical protein PLY16_01185 [Candidatus Saccharibacteria bacterium]|nr:hypothetical protein [Candidatus Saccharibacteria bacterium]